MSLTGKYSSLVPRGITANGEYRIAQKSKGYESPESAAALIGMCRKDPLFFINTFCWTSNPMWHPNYPEREFITYPFQEHAIERMASSLARAGRTEHIGKTDLVWLKSRGMGASWIALLFMLWRCMFFRSQSFLLVSRTAALVDKPKDPNALMPKLDFVIERLPGWLRPRLRINDRVEMKMYFPQTDSIINGQSTTGDLARGGRPTAIMLDEFGFFDFKDGFEALRSATGASFCCWFVSTTNGMGNAFHKVVTEAEIERIDFRWENMPAKRVGLYRSVEGRVELLDKHRHPENYPFIDDGLLRSVWYDAEERRVGMRSLMAQEHDCDFVGSGDPFFSPSEIKALLERTSPPRSFEHYRSDNGSRGKLNLWLADRASKSPPLDRCYVIGVDISAGTGASNSCLRVFDCRERKIVGELAEPKLDPTELAEIANQVGLWFEDWSGAPALIIWEGNGSIGPSFGKRLDQLHYPNPYYSVANLSPEEKKSRSPGFWTTNQSKPILLRAYGVGLLGKDFEDPSRESIEECRDFRYFTGGKIEHYKMGNATDASGARDNHGDRVMAAALALRGASSISAPTPTLDSPVEPIWPCFYNDMVEHRKAMSQERRIEEGWLAG